MRTLFSVIIHRNVRPLLGCLAIFTALALVSVPLQSTITEGKNVQDAVGNTQASLVTDAAPLVPQKPPFDFDGDNKSDYAVVRNVGGTLN